MFVLCGCCGTWPLAGRRIDGVMYCSDCAKVVERLRDLPAAQPATFDLTAILWGDQTAAK